MWSHGAEARLADRPTPRRIPSVASVNMRRGFGLRLNGFRGSRRAFRLSRLRPPRPTVAPKSSSKLTLRWSERDSKSRSRRQRNGRGEGARSNPSVAIGPELNAVVPGLPRARWATIRESGTESSTGPAQSPEWRPGWILKLRCTDFRTPQANTTLVHRDAPLPSLRGAYPTGEIVNRRSGTWWRQSISMPTGDLLGL